MVGWEAEIQSNLQIQLWAAGGWRVSQSFLQCRVLLWFTPNPFKYRFTELSIQVYSNVFFLLISMKYSKSQSDLFLLLVSQCEPCRACWGADANAGDVIPHAANSIQIPSPNGWQNPTKRAGMGFWAGWGNQGREAGAVEPGSAPRVLTMQKGFQTSVPSPALALTSRNELEGLNFSFSLNAFLTQVASATTLALGAEIVMEWHCSLSFPQHQRQCHQLGLVSLFNVRIWQSRFWTGWV